MTLDRKRSCFRCRWFAARRGFEIAALALLAAAGGCGGRDPYGVPALSEALKDPNPDTRYTAANLLGQHGSAARSAMPALCEALKDTDANVRMRAAYSLADIGPDASAMPLLIEALKDPNRQVRMAAASALPAIGPDAGSALEALREAQNDADAEVRGEIAKAIRRIELSLKYRTGGAGS